MEEAEAIILKNLQIIVEEKEKNYGYCEKFLYHLAMDAPDLRRCLYRLIARFGVMVLCALQDAKVYISDLVNKYPDYLKIVEDKKRKHIILGEKRVEAELTKENENALMFWKTHSRYVYDLSYFREKEVFAKCVLYHLLPVLNDIKAEKITFPSHLRYDSTVHNIGMINTKVEAFERGKRVLDKIPADQARFVQKCSFQGTIRSYIHGFGTLAAELVAMVRALERIEKDPPLIYARQFVKECIRWKVNPKLVELARNYYLACKTRDVLQLNRIVSKLSLLKMDFELPKSTSVNSEHGWGEIEKWLIEINHVDLEAWLVGLFHSLANRKTIEVSDDRGISDEEFNILCLLFEKPLINISEIQNFLTEKDSAFREKSFRARWNAVEKSLNDLRRKGLVVEVDKSIVKKFRTGSKPAGRCFELSEENVVRQRKYLRFDDLFSRTLYA